jgi:hypothetical protein
LFLDPDKLFEASPAEVLEAAAEGVLGLDHRFLRALIDRREEALPAALEFLQGDRSGDRVDLTPDLIALFRYWRAPEAIPFLVEQLREPEYLTEEVIEALVAIGEPALEPLLHLYGELDPSQSEEVAFTLASLGIRDERILQVLTSRLEQDPSDALFLLSIYGDPAARPAIEQVAARWTSPELKKEAENVLHSLEAEPPASPREPEPFDIFALYPETASPDLDALDENERLALLDHASAAIRAAAAASFFNRKLNREQRSKLLHTAQNDPAAQVRARAWETLINETEETQVIEAMLHALRNPQTTIEERGGLLVGLSAEADRKEVRWAIEELYQAPEGRAKALEAMWRSLHPSFRDYFAKHLDDPDIHVRRAAIWGVGYFGIRSELERLRQLFDDEELRADALFAYTLAVPGETSRGRVKSLLSRVEKDAQGLSEMEEELVKAAIDERLILAGKEPVFSREEG